MTMRDVVHISYKIYEVRSISVQRFIVLDDDEEDREKNRV